MVRHLFFIQAGFVTVFVAAVSFQVDSLALRFFKNQFLVCCCYFFLVCSVCSFYCCGVRTKFGSLYFFRLLRACAFFSCNFSFHTEGFSAFVLVAVFGLTVGSLLFRKLFLKSYLALQFLLFNAAVFGGQC